MKQDFKPNNAEVWSQLARQQHLLQQTNLVELFKQDPGRFDVMHARGAGLLLDYSRNLVTTDTINLLVNAAESVGLQQKIKALFAGEHVNTTEDRPALHTALRDFTGQSKYSTEINAVFQRMADLVEQIHSGAWQGSSSKPLTDIVNIGIGGSHLGPMLATEALAGFHARKVDCHFVSNIDGTDLDSSLSRLNPETTLFIIASKSFTTLETLQNARTARAWLTAGLNNKIDVSRHFIAVTAKPDSAEQFGIAKNNILPMWDWVGGRYSLWSAIGLPIALSIGMENFNRLREGAAEMDQHFINTPLQQNLPVLLALIGVWHINYWHTSSQAVLPYLHRLRSFPQFLQQLEMESNGKSVRLDGTAVDYPTNAVIWGSEGTNGQHSFHQLLHQGTHIIPVDFILALNPEQKDDTHHAYLVANCLAQANVLMTGRSQEEARAALVASGMTNQDADRLAANQQMPGNRPSNMIIVEHLTPETLGALIALYEHKVYVQSVIWDINAFDQWGVESGKTISNRIYDRLVRDDSDIKFDASTEALIKLYRKEVSIAKE